MMKMKCGLVLAVFGLLITTAYADQPKNYRIQLSNMSVGTTALAAGEYTVLVHRDGNEPKIRLTEVNTRRAIDVVATVEIADTKFMRTEVHGREVNGVTQISEIRIGGTNFRIGVQPGS